MSYLPATDLLLDTADDLSIASGDFCVGPSLTQEVKTLLRLNQGALKSDPLLGPNLLQLVRSEPDAQEFEQRIKIHLQRDGKDYHDIRELIHPKSKF